MDLKQLQYFVVSADSGSFKRAAEVLYTSQPHISKTIKSLEAELGFTILERKARGVEVTDAGKKVYEHACRILMESSRILEVHDTRNTHTLRVAASPGDWIADLYCRFYQSEKENGLHAQYTEAEMGEIFQLLHRHAADVGLICVDRQWMTAFRQRLEYRHLEYEELGETEPRLYVGPQNPLYHAESVGSKELRELHYVQMAGEQESLSTDLVQASEDYHQHRRRGQILVTSSRHMLLETIQKTDICSISCGFLPRTPGYEDIRGIPVRGTQKRISFGYARRKRDELLPEAARLVEFIKGELN